MIIVRITEGLGNQMFQYALARSIAQRGQQVWLDVKNPYLDYEDYQGKDERKYTLNHFNITLKKIDIQKNLSWRFLRRKTIIEKMLYELSRKERWPFKYIEETYFFGKYNPKLLVLKGNYYLGGTFQNERYFKDIRKILLKEFQLKKHPIVSKELISLLKGNIASVHIRRGDYLAFQKTIGLCSISYYKKAMTYMKEKKGTKVFLFFSNDLDWVKENFIPEGEDIYCFINEDESLKDYEELTLMSKCKHNIIANSSFSWWGAWLNENPDKLVIAPKIWFRNDLSYKIVPNEWITM